MIDRLITQGTRGTNGELDLASRAHLDRDGHLRSAGAISLRTHQSGRPRERNSPEARLLRSSLPSLRSGAVNGYRWGMGWPTRVPVMRALLRLSGAMPLGLRRKKLVPHPTTHAAAPKRDDKEHVKEAGRTTAEAAREVKKLYSEGKITIDQRNDAIDDLESESTKEATDRGNGARGYTFVRYRTVVRAAWLCYRKGKRKPEGMFIVYTVEIAETYIVLFGNKAMYDATYQHELDHYDIAMKAADDANGPQGPVDPFESRGAAGVDDVPEPGEVVNTSGNILEAPGALEQSARDLRDARDGDYDTVTRNGAEGPDSPNLSAGEREAVAEMSTVWIGHAGDRTRARTRPAGISAGWASVLLKYVGT